MTEEQRRFKIKKKESLENLASQEQKYMMRSFRMGAICAGLALAIFSLPLGPDDLKQWVFNSLAGFSFTIVSISELKDMIESIAKKTNLESKIEDINNELTTYEQEEKRGMHR